MSPISTLLRSTALVTTVIGLMTGAAYAGSGSISYQMDYVSSFGGGYYSNPEQIISGPDNNLYIASRGTSTILVFDKNGNYLSQFGTPGSGAGELNGPVGMAFTNDGKLIVSELFAGRAQIFDATTHAYIGPFATGQLSNPYYLKTDAAGNVYIPSYTNGNVKIFDTNGNLLQTLSTPGLSPLDQGISSDNKLYVPSYYSNSVEIYDATTFAHIGTLATSGSAPGQVTNPYGVSLDAQNNIYVTEQGNNRISIFDTNGNLLLVYDNSSGGHFGQPDGLYVDTDGKVYVNEYVGGVTDILQFTSTETFSGSPPGGDEVATTPLSNLRLTGTITFADNFIGYNNIEIAGNTTLSGNSSFTGQLYTSAGTLINDGALSFLFGNNFTTITNNGTMNIGNYFQNFATFTNDGTINSNNFSSYGGTFTNNGTVNGNATVFGGVYAGEGNVSGNFNGEGGTIDLGAANRTLSIGGNYTNNGASTYIVESDAAGQASKISVTGTAAINNGSIVQVNAANGVYHVNNNYEIFAATGGITGTFSSVTSNLAFLTPTLSYTANAVTLTLTRNDGIDPFPPNVDFTAYAASSNDAAAATALSAYSANSFNGDTATFDAVQSLSVADARKLVSEVSPDQVAAMPAVQTAMITTMQTPMFQRLQSAPVSSSDKSGFGFVTPDASGSSLSPDQVWLQTIGGVSNQDNSSNGAAGYRLGTVGVRGGADKDINDKTKLGLSFAYAHGTANYKGSNDSSQTQYAHADLYGRHELNTKKNIILEGFLGAGGGRLDSTRYITAGTLNNTIIGNTNAYDVSGAVKLSNPIRITPSDIITPNITTAASWTRQNGYTETGSPFALQMNSITSTPVTVTPMVNWQHTIKDEKHGFNLTPDLGIGATWQLSELNNNVNANFANSTTAPSFTTQSAKQDPLSLNLSAAVTMQPFNSNKYVPQLTAQATAQTNSTTTNTTATLTAKWDW